VQCAAGTRTLRIAEFPAYFPLVLVLAFNMIEPIVMEDLKRARFENHAIQARAFNTQGGADFKSMVFTYLIKFHGIPRPFKSMSFELRDVAMKSFERLLKRPKFKKSNKRGLSRAKSNNNK
jgi:hypothetical protein